VATKYWFQSQSSTCGIYIGRSGPVAGFLQEINSTQQSPT